MSSTPECGEQRLSTYPRSFYRLSLTEPGAWLALLNVPEDRLEDKWALMALLKAIVLNCRYMILFYIYYT